MPRRQSMPLDYFLNFGGTPPREGLHGTANLAVHALNCTKLTDLEGVLATFEQLRRRASIRPIEAYEYLRRIMRGISQCSLLLHNLQMEAPSDDKADRLIAGARRSITDWKFDKSMNPQGAGGGGAARRGVARMQKEAPQPQYSRPLTSVACIRSRLATTRASMRSCTRTATLDEKEPMMDLRRRRMR